MKLKALNLKWALAFAGAVVVGAAGVVLVLTLMRGGDDQATAQPDSPTATPLATLTAMPAGTATPLATAPGQNQGTPTSVSALPEDLGWRVVISGPDTAHPGEQVTYEIHYECVRQASGCKQLGLEFGWTDAAASLVESSPKGGVGVSGQGLAWAVNEGGVIRVVLRVAEGFQGDLHMGVYTRGTNITYSEGSVDQLTTRVVAEPTP